MGKDSSENTLFSLLAFLVLFVQVQKVRKNKANGRIIFAYYTSYTPICQNLSRIHKKADALRIRFFHFLLFYTGGKRLMTQPATNTEVMVTDAKPATIMLGKM